LAEQLAIFGMLCGPGATGLDDSMAASQGAIDGGSDDLVKIGGFFVTGPWHTR
jgi:hypothetical protein